ncbi:hypothetical protein CI109_105437 [Kwoniella shandongensis]|uniref:Uncharacterized protein n=1 Tax=Kwoniella shandongensis TaxID=1734106 RepID=A0A5M6C2B8_9TREE|nr:uncharacterized protein CI109_002158 [Kwoniella shandongensis]KAA5529268.1 hypothetical protein CI109_002158 [Kwoniella shandongensis]
MTNPDPNKSSKWDSRLRLISYNLTKPLTSLHYPLYNKVPFSLTFHILSMVLAFVTLVIVALWAAATAGFESVTVLDSNFNRADNEHWYTPFLPTAVIERQRGRLCDPAALAVGTTFTTTAPMSLLQYSVAGYSTAVPEYRGTSLSGCQIWWVTIDVDSVRHTLSSEARLFCPYPWIATISTYYTYSILASDLGNPTILAPAALVASDDLDSLAFELISRSYALWLRGNNTTVEGQGGGVGPREDGTGWDLSSALLRSPDFAEGPPTVGPANVSYHGEPPFVLEYFLLSSPGKNEIVAYSSQPSNTIDSFILNTYIPTSNFLIALLSAIRSDIGNSTSNIYTDSSVAARLLSTNDTWVNKTLLNLEIEHSLPYAQSVVDHWGEGGDWEGRFVVQNESGIMVGYLCHLTRGKGEASGIVAVLGLTLSIWGSFWTGYMLFVSHFAQQRDTRTEARMKSHSTPSPHDDEEKGLVDEPLLNDTHLGRGQGQMGLCRRTTV